MGKDPYKNSNYDSAGMPLGVEYVDYDNKEDVAKATVKDKPVDLSLSIAEATSDYEEPKIKTRTEVNPANFNTAIEVPGHKRPSKKEDVGTGISEIKDPPDQVDLDNPEVHEQLAKEDPKETNKTKLESDKVEHNKKDDSGPDSDFEKALKNV